MPLIIQYFLTEQNFVYNGRQPFPDLHNAITNRSSLLKLILQYVSFKNIYSSMLSLKMN